MFGIFKMVFLVIIALVIILCITIFNTGIAENPKDKIINIYDSFIQSFDTAGLTSNWQLKGKRKYGIDKYVGTYVASYDNYSAEETIFGGTAISRKNGDHVKVKIKIEKESGNIDVIAKLGNNETSLISNTGEYEDSIYIEGVSYYLTIKLVDFKGNIDITAE
ncbi:MAG: hypothetical protein HFJ54_09235 [Clostridia bacterium]|nr:hypothetical protein [Clostridia bacterium]